MGAATSVALAAIKLAVVSRTAYSGASTLAGPQGPYAMALPRARSDNPSKFDILCPRLPLRIR